MKEFRRNIRMIGVLLICLFVGVSGWFGWSVYTQGSRWLVNQHNNRLNNARSRVIMGDITDRTGMVLAATNADGTRVYSASSDTRRALSQTVGDQLSMSGTGVETFHAGTLLGFSGSIIDRAWQWLSGESTRGDNIRLTVDAELTTYISSHFPDGYEGAVALINYKTGEILAMVSKEDYDPNDVGRWQETGSAYLNRCLQGQYAPGSIFKLVTLAASLDAGVISPSALFECTGSCVFEDHVKVTCKGGTAHGQLTLEQALSSSCNVTFAQLGYQLGASRLLRACQSFGFNDNFRFQDIVLYESSFPSDIETPGELGWSAVGQGRVLVTPLHMAMIAGAVGNGGVMASPKLILQVTGSTGISRLRTPSVDYGRVMTAATADILDQYMQSTVEEGTAYRAQVDGYTICGKTGTAEVSDNIEDATNAWFVGYIDSDEHPYAIAVLIEKGGSGSDKPAALASRAFQRAIEILS